MRSDPCDEKFYLVEEDEPGIYRGYVISKNEIDVFLIQSGAFPVVGFGRMNREGDLPADCN